MCRLRAISESLALMVLVITAVTWALAEQSSHPSAWGPRYTGGATTIFPRPGATDANLKNIFGLPAPNLTKPQLEDFDLGKRIFQQSWFWAPGPAPGLDGLGPLFNQNSCIACHVMDGRGQPPDSPDEPMTTMVVRISVPGTDKHGGPQPHPVYGTQINTRAIRDVPPEGRVSVRYEPITGSFADGTEYQLQKPIYWFVEMNYGPLGSDVMFSPRVAPMMFGLGLFEAVPEESILALAREQAKHNDGITGKPNWVWDHIHRRKALGRFGWKAGQPSLRQQLAMASLQDMGLTTSHFPQENVRPAQTVALRQPSGGVGHPVAETTSGKIFKATKQAQTTPELSDHFLDKLTLYSQTLAVPGRRDENDPIVLRGEAIFTAMNCHACHVPELRTAEHPTIPQLSNQRFFPYTDMLLHDMGEALADGRPEYQATGRHWRTPPLWGLGLVPVVNGHTRYLHDGRARNLEEAILWHGGEAERSRDAYLQLPKLDREAVIAFLKSL